MHGSHDTARRGAAPLRRRGGGGVALVAVALFGATVGARCGGAPPPRYPIRDAARVRDVLRARESRIGLLRAEGSLDQFGRQGRVRGTVGIYVRLPDHFRVEASAFGNVVGLLVSDGAQFSLLQGTQWAHGPARPCVAAQLGGIPMAARDVATLLTGGAPLISEQMSPARWEDGAYVVDLAGEGGATERIELALPPEQRDWPPERQTPRIRRVVLRDRQGLRADITYDGYRDVEGSAFPSRVRVVMPRENVDTMIRFDRIQPNFTIPPDPENPGAPPPDPFDQTPPPGIQQVPIDC